MTIEDDQSAMCNVLRGVRPAFDGVNDIIENEY